MELKDDERLDHILGEGLKIIQSPSVFAFSLDAVLLARFVSVPVQKGKILDMCSGNGIIPLFLTTRTKAEIIRIEIQPKLYDMGIRSIQYNQLEAQIQMFCGDIKKISANFSHGSFDVVTCNPPYFAIRSKEEINQNPHFAIARHELKCTLEDVVGSGAFVLKEGGKFALVHRPERLIEIILLMKKYKIEPKRMQLVYPKLNREANMLLIEGIKSGKSEIKILPPFYVYEESGNYTEEMRKILRV